jgi:hypothetical protein
VRQGDGDGAAAGAHVEHAAAGRQALQRQFHQHFGIGAGISTASLTSNGRPKNSRWPTM